MTILNRTSFWGGAPDFKSTAGWIEIEGTRVAVGISYFAKSLEGNIHDYQFGTSRPTGVGVDINYGVQVTRHDELLQLGGFGALKILRDPQSMDSFIIGFGKNEVPEVPSRIHPRKRSSCLTLRME
jgi:hypothetical protein